MVLGQTKTRPESPGVHFPYLRVANIKDGLIDFSDIAEMPFVNPERYILQPGDILLCEGQSRELVGRAALYTGELGPLLFQNSLIRFRAYANIVPEYALAVFRAYQKSGVFAGIAKSTTNIAHLGLSRFTDLPFPLPPPVTQSELVDNIKAIQDTLDFISDVVNNGLGELANIFQTARDEAILGVGVDGMGQGASIVRRSRWPVMPAKDVVKPDAPIVYGIVQPGPNVDEGVPYVRGLDLKDGYIEIGQLWRTTSELAARYERSALLPGDVLLNIIRHTRVAIVPSILEGANISRTTARLRPDDMVTSEYLFHWLSSASAQNWLQSRMRGIDMPGLNLQDVRQLPVPVPPLPAQEEISAHLDEVVAQANDLLAAFSFLRDSLPGLEEDLIRSFAYGEAAATISRKLPEDVQSALSAELRESLREKTVQSKYGMKFAIEGVTATEEMAQSAAIIPEVSVVRPTRDGGSSTDPEQVLEALTSLGGRASPEELYSFMKLAEVAVDSFYTSLRGLVDAGIVREIRPDYAAVVLQMAAKE